MHSPGTPLSPSENEQVLDALGRILASPNFKASERKSRFLRYVVEETLAGRANKLKGYTVAVQAFGRSPAFDPQTSPLVRVEARRLRQALEHYYLTAGKSDPVRILIPKGSYVPIFEHVTAAQTMRQSAVLEIAPAWPPRRPHWIFAAALAVSAVMIIVLAA